ncbi:MAG: formate dehydrogenase accessory sulfurtransferase FdhD [Desulfovibrio sp.]
MSKLLQGTAQFVKTPCRRFNHDAWSDFTDTVTPEQSVTVQLSRGETLHLWAFPEDLEELVFGHALLELCTPEETPEVSCTAPFDYSLNLLSKPPRTFNGPELPVLTGEALLSIMQEFIGTEGKWDSTGCFHRAGAYDPHLNQFAFMVEDIGRHNCVDRLAAKLYAAEKSPHSYVYVATARVTASLMGKISKAGFRAIISKSAVTTATLAAAEKLGVSLAGFAREKRATVFHDPHGLFSSKG